MRLIAFFMLFSFSPGLRADENMGRLFSEPSERAALNQLRMTQKEMTQQTTDESLPAPASRVTLLPEQLTLQGYVKRSDGKQGTVWINQQAMQENSRHQEITVGNISSKNNRVPIKLNANGRQLALKAGQSFEPETNQVRESRIAVDGQAADPLSGGQVGDN